MKKILKVEEKEMNKKERQIVERDLLAAKTYYCLVQFKSSCKKYSYKTLDGNLRAGELVLVGTRNGPVAANFVCYLSVMNTQDQRIIRLANAWVYVSAKEIIQKFLERQEAIKNGEE